MSEYKFEELAPISKGEALAAFRTSDPNLISDALIRLGCFEPDWKWVQQKCLSFADSDDHNVSRASILALTHLVRIHRRLDLEQVLPKLINAQQIPELAGFVQDTIEDIELFVTGGDDSSLS